MILKCKFAVLLCQKFKMAIKLIYWINSVKFYKQHLDEKIHDAQAKSTDVEGQIVILENAGGVNIFLPWFLALLKVYQL